MAAIYRRVKRLPKKVVDLRFLMRGSTAAPRKPVLDYHGKSRPAKVRAIALPTHLVVFFVVTLAVHMQSSYHEVPRFLLDGLRLLADSRGQLRVAGQAGIS